MRQKEALIRTARIVVACMFAAGVGFSETLKSAVQYSDELETKQSSIVSIKEDTGAIENALKEKLKRFHDRRIEFSSRDITAIIPSAPGAALTMRATPYGTLAPRGNTGVIDRGVNKKEGERN